MKLPTTPQLPLSNPSPQQGLLVLLRGMSGSVLVLSVSVVLSVAELPWTRL